MVVGATGEGDDRRGGDPDQDQESDQSEPAPAPGPSDCRLATTLAPPVLPGVPGGG